MYFKILIILNTTVFIEINILSLLEQYVINFSRMTTILEVEIQLS